MVFMMIFLDIVLERLGFAIIWLHIVINLGCFTLNFFFNCSCSCRQQTLVRDLVFRKAVLMLQWCKKFGVDLHRYTTSLRDSNFAFFSAEEKPSIRII